MIINYNGENYDRIPVKTHLLTKKDNIVDVAKKYTSSIIEKGDIIFVSEKAVSITQGRAVPLDEIKPRKLAVFLSNHVQKTKHGIGLGIPETMEMALIECGVPRILFASFVSFFSKLFGKKGNFYRVAGYKAASIDGPTPYTIPPYNKYVVLGPKDPDITSQEISKKINTTVTIVDINDLGGNVLGKSDNNVDSDMIVALLKDNPLGQSNKQTPIGIIRKVS